MVTWIGDSDFNDKKSSSVMGSGGGYDLEEIQQAHEVLSGHEGDEKGFEKVDPIFIEVIPNAQVVREEEYEARVVILEYDTYDNIVSVELL